MTLYGLEEGGQVMAKKTGVEKAIRILRQVEVL